MSRLGSHPLQLFWLACKSFGSLDGLSRKIWLKRVTILLNDIHSTICGISKVLALVSLGFSSLADPIMLKVQHWESRKPQCRHKGNLINTRISSYVSQRQHNDTVIGFFSRFVKQLLHYFAELVTLMFSNRISLNLLETAIEAAYLYSKLQRNSKL